MCNMYIDHHNQRLYRFLFNFIYLLLLHYLFNFVCLSFFDILDKKIFKCFRIFCFFLNFMIVFNL